MEQKSVHAVLDEAPEEEAKSPPTSNFEATAKSLGCEICTIHNTGDPDSRYQPPWGLGQGLEKVAKQRRRLSTFVVSRTVNLIQVKLFGESAAPDLHKERLVEVQKLVLLEIRRSIGVLAQIFFTRHASSRVNIGSRSVGRDAAIFTINLLFDEKAYKRVVQNFIGGLGMFVGSLIFKDVFNVLSSVVHDQTTTTGVVINKIGDIVDFGADSDVARRRRVMGFDFGSRKRWKVSRRHDGQGHECQTGVSCNKEKKNQRKQQMSL